MPITRILKRKTRLVDHLGAAFLDHPVTDFPRLVDLAAALLPAAVYRPALADSLRHLAGERLSARLLEETAWRLAGNVHRLTRHRPVYPWRGQALAEWVPAQVVAVRPSRRVPWGDEGGDVDFRVLGGLCCPAVLTKWWSYRRGRVLAPALGFSHPVSQRAPFPQRYPFGHLDDLVSLRLYLLIDPKLCGHDPGFDKVQVPPQVRPHNREIIRCLYRIDEGYTCPLGLPASFACRRCVKGYESCKAGRHRRDYRPGPCQDCGDAHAPFDPDHPSSTCVDCETRDRLRGEQRRG